MEFFCFFVLLNSINSFIEKIRIDKFIYVLLFWRWHCCFGAESSYPGHNKSYHIWQWNAKIQSWFSKCTKKERILLWRCAESTTMIQIRMHQCHDFNKEWFLFYYEIHRQIIDRLVYRNYECFLSIEFEDYSWWLYSIYQW